MAASTSGITTSIDAVLLRCALLETKGTSVTVTTLGEVTLSGTVHSWTERTHAGHIAWSAPGVTGVVNDMRVEG